MSRPPPIAALPRPIQHVNHTSQRQVAAPWQRRERLLAHRTAPVHPPLLSRRRSCVESVRCPPRAHTTIPIGDPTVGRGPHRPLLRLSPCRPRTIPSLAGGPAPVSRLCGRSKMAEHVREDEQGARGVAYDPTLLAAFCRGLRTTRASSGSEAGRGRAVACGGR